MTTISGSKPRATAQTWIAEGLKALEISGPASLGAETIARRIGLSKGSFYWHFKDVPAFHQAVLAHWRREAEMRFLQSLSGESPRLQLRGLDTYQPSPLDCAVRAWGCHSPGARTHIEVLDDIMIREISTRLTLLELPNPDFARLIHGSVISSRKDWRTTATLVDLLMVLT